jgi:hypothetical protein
MITFTKEQQSQARKSFIEKSRENAWGAACHADFLAKTIEGLFAEHQKLIDEDARLETEIKALDNTTDHHTVDNRTKRKRMQEIRQQISKQMEVAKTAVQRAMQQMQELLQTAEFNLKLAKHAETWEWKEVDNETEEVKSTS